MKAGQPIVRINGIRVSTCINNRPDDMDIDPIVLPNELALYLADKCQKWTYAAYTGQPEINDAPRNATVDARYETRLDRTITDIQAKIQSQKRVLDDVFPPNALAKG